MSDPLSDQQSAAFPVIPALVALVALVTVVLTFLAVLIITGHTDAESTPAVVTILGIVGNAVAFLLLALQAWRNQQGIRVTQRLMNGHLAEHVDLANNVQAVVTNSSSSPPVAPVDATQLPRPGAPPAGGSNG